jgi:HPt (histidine-containing phosphotransfer) domain-containing protein
MPPEPGQVDTATYLSVCRSGDTLDVALMKELLGYFVTGNERRMLDATQAAGADDRAALREIAHAVRGSAALVGAARLRDLAETLELESATAERADMAAGVAALAAEFAAVRASLRARHPEAYD